MGHRKPILAAVPLPGLCPGSAYVGDLACYGPFSSTCGSCSYDGFMSYHGLVDGLNPRIPNVFGDFLNTKSCALSAND
jgi:hypothetical protein